MSHLKRLGYIVVGYVLVQVKATYVYQTGITTYRANTVTKA